MKIIIETKRNENINVLTKTRDMYNIINAISRNLTVHSHKK